MLGRKQLHTYRVTHIIKKPFEEVRETYHRLALNDCRLVFGLQAYAATLWEEYSWVVSLVEIRRVDGSIVNFAETVNNHVGGEHFFRSCPKPHEATKRMSNEEFSQKLQQYVLNGLTQN